jgi:hypothetical protein
MGTVVKNISLNKSNNQKLDLELPDGKQARIDIRNFETIESLGLNNFNPSEYTNLTPSDFWYVYDIIKTIAPENKFERTLLTEQQVRKKALEIIAKYDKNNLSDIEVLRKKYHRSRLQALKNLDFRLKLLIHLFGRSSNKKKPEINVQDGAIYSTGGYLTFTQIQMYIDILNNYNLSIKLIQGFEKKIAEYDPDAIKVTGEQKAKESNIIPPTKQIDSSKTIKEDTGIHQSDGFIDTKTYLDTNRQLENAHNKIKELTEKTKSQRRTKADNITREELIAIADQSRFKNGNINYSILGKKLNVTYHTAFQMCRTHKIL